MKNVNILGFLLDIPIAKRGVSGSRAFLYKHLRGKNFVSTLIDAEMSSIQKRLNLIKNFSFNKSLWLTKNNLDVTQRRKRTNMLKNKMNVIDRNYNCTLQVGSGFSLAKVQELKNIPKFFYGDNNVMNYIKYGFDTQIINNNQRMFKNIIQENYDFEKEVYDDLTGIMCMTEYHKKSFINEFNLPEEKIYNINFGCNLDNSLIQDYEKDYSDRTILFVAKDSFKDKGGELLLDAFTKVKEKYADAKILIVGPKQNIDISGVKWVGYINKKSPGGMQKLINFYKSSTLFVMPSFGEPTGNVFLEAMAFKLPCIGADQGATPEILIKNDCGRVLTKKSTKELSNLIIEMFENEDQMKKYGRNGFAAIKTIYNWDVVLDKAHRIMASYL